VVPKLLASGWDTEPHSIAEQRTITDGRIVPVGQGFVRKPPKRVDYLLRYTRDFPLAVVEAKAACVYGYLRSFFLLFASAYF
jgi:type I restriction enzyme R subunit